MKKMNNFSPTIVCLIATFSLAVDCVFEAIENLA